MTAEDADEAESSRDLDLPCKAELCHIVVLGTAACLVLVISRPHVSIRNTIPPLSLCVVLNVLKVSAPPSSRVFLHHG